MDFTKKYYPLQVQIMHYQDILYREFNETSYFDVVNVFIISIKGI
jgi:hypothetical protein